MSTRMNAARQSALALAPESIGFDILHKVGIRASSEGEVYQALTTIEGLCAWWTGDTRGESKVGSVLQFRFNGGGLT